MNYSIIINVLLIAGLCFLCYSFVIKEQNPKLNWSIFYAVLWVSISLFTVNYICVKFNFWEYLNSNATILQLPLELYFIWIIVWGILPFYFFKGKHLLILLLVLFWADIILMPKLADYNVLILNKNWIIGEILTLVVVFIPSYLWAKFSYQNSNIKLRALFQVVVMTVFIMFIIPYLTFMYLNGYFNIGKFSPILTQIIFIIAFPSLIAVIDLVEKGLGTPFPYDPTKRLVQTGVYAYCKNPIQWSFTLLFIPISIHYENYILLFGSFASFLYTIGISNPQEYTDMLKRFNKDWSKYKKTVPSWYFIWKPTNIPKGVVYFKKDCNQCEQIKEWFEAQNPINLEIKYADEYESSTLLQVTYLHHYNIKYSSIKAIAHSLEHINLAYACLGWFMRFPFISYLLQSIIDAMDFTPNCELE